MRIQVSDGATLRAISRVAIAAVGVVWAAAAFAAVSENKALTAELAWAYPSGPDTSFGQPLGPGPFRMPGSSLIVTRTQMESAEGPIDWFPNDHPPAPGIVKGSAGSESVACAECHGMNGAGFPGSAELAGLPAAYIVEQVTAFASGERRSADPDQPNTAAMIAAAKSVTPEQLQQAAEYFAHLPWGHRLRVVEVSTVPKTTPDKFGWLNPAFGGGTEPIGDRIVELSANLSQSFLGNDHIGLTDYVPRGALARGRVIAETGGHSGTPCIACHGARLTGTPTAPPLAGKSAVYLARTIWDIRVGARHGSSVTLMLQSSKALRPAEIRDVAAYLASLKP